MNGNLENNEYIFQSITIRASRKRLRRLKEIAAYNVGQCLSSEHDVNWLNLPKTLEKLVKKFVNTFSGDYITNSLVRNLFLFTPVVRLVIFFAYKDGIFFPNPLYVI